MQFLKFWDITVTILNLKIEPFYYCRKNPQKSAENPMYIKYIEFFGIRIKTNTNALTPKRSGAAQFMKP